MDSAREAGGGVAGPVLMRFVWPYGGKNVFLCGSFNRWSKIVPMSPVEGCPTVFQAICSVTPGYHQFKFHVDGEWRHDEHQSCMISEYGMVNTVLVPVDPNYSPAITSEMPSGSIKDWDNEDCRSMVHMSDGMLTGAVSSISVSELQVSRHRVSVFLSTHTVYELLPASGKVIVLDINLPVKQAFHTLHEQGVSMAPLWDEGTGQFVGVLSASDFILILRELGTHGSNLTEEELDTHTISAWKEGKTYLNRQIDGHGSSFSRHLIHAGPYDNLKDVALKILQNEVATVPIIHSSSEDGSFPQLLYLASLPGILKCICRYFSNCTGILPVIQLPICAIPVGTWVPRIGESNRRPLATLKPSASLSSALNLLIQAQALQLGQDSQTDYKLRNQRCQRCQMCLRSDSLYKVMERLASPGVRRLVIVEAGSKRVEGIVTLTDIFKFLLSQ